MTETPKKYLNWVEESTWAFAEPRSEMWRDCEMYDGGKAQWTQEDWDLAQDAGIDPITINRTFPAVNMILGTEAVQRFDIRCKGRTHKDNEIGQIMTESMKFVMDQSAGQYLVALAFKDQVIPGFGCIHPGFNLDPRKEKLRLKHVDWKEIWWDIFCPDGPWFNPENCKYVFRRPWVNLDDLVAMFPEKKKEIEEHFQEMCGSDSALMHTNMMDEADQIEWDKRTNAGYGWVEEQRKRVRPVELWHPEWEMGLFAKYADGRVIEIQDDMYPNEKMQIIMTANELIRTVVQKMYVTTFLNKIVLLDMKSPFPHDQYPFVPFVGYVDRNGYPYGVPRQIRGQNEEINFRRSMEKKALLARRVMIERNAVDGGQAELDNIYEEANKLDGFLILKDGAIGNKRIMIDENAAIIQGNRESAAISEAEIQQISGVNDEAMGYRSNAKSGVALEKRQQRSAVILSTLFDNLARSLQMVGEQLVANIQGAWTGEKVLRITDRLSGAEKFVEINKVVVGSDNQIHVKNNICQGKYDVIVTEMPLKDTVREMYIDFFNEWAKKAPPEVIPHIFIAALELSEFPNKDILLQKMKPLLGVDPREEDLTAEELKEKAIQQIDARAQEQEQLKQMATESQLAEMEKTQAETRKLIAQMMDILAEIKREDARLRLERESHDTEQFQQGMDIGDRVMGKNDTGTGKAVRE